MSMAHRYPDEMTCSVCDQPFGRVDRKGTAIIWPDPAGIWCVAHRACLVRLGERDLDLPPVA